MTEQLEEIIVEQKCDKCGKIREAGCPDYSPVQAFTTGILGWYSGDDGEFCPQDIAAMMNNANRTDSFRGWKP